MCALQPGQFVEVAASLTSCFRLHSKHAITRIRCRFQKPSILRKPVGAGAGATSSFGRSIRPAFGALGAKLRPHWRHIVLLAAAYSICLKPHCGHSTLTLAGDGFVGTIQVSSSYLKLKY